MRVLVGIVLLVGAIPIALFGGFLVLYEGDTPGGDPYVRIGDMEIDAQLVGALSLVLAAAMVASAWLLARPRST